MIQDIYPHRLYNSYIPCEPDADDSILFFDNKGALLADISGDVPKFPRASDIPGIHAVYLFSVDEKKYFLASDEYTGIPGNYAYHTTRSLRERYASENVIFAVFTAYHLWRWYSDNIFCSRCGSRLSHKSDERALVCPECAYTVYPRINPAVIVGVMDGDCLLLTRYNRGYAHNALVAGFAEIGETLEQTVSREVMEETGIKVTNIRYYGSQPWGTAQDILTGFFCEADGSTDINMDKSELKYAEWVKRDDIVLQPDDLSLTNEMMTAFKYNRIDPLPVYRSLLKATTNTRELGGLRTADGRITRSDVFWRSDAPVAYLAEDAETLRRHGITTLIDLRTDKEVGDKPCAYTSPEFDYHNFTITEGSRPPASLEDVPQCYMDAAASKNMAKALHAAAEAKGGVMFFCAAGKDRTGVLAAIILLACGVDRYSVIHNYTLSREYNKTRLEAYIASHPGIDRRIILANESSMESFITKLYEKYGSIGGYFESNGLSQEYALLRKKMISEQQ